MPSATWQSLRARAIERAAVGYSGTFTTGDVTNPIDTARQEPDNFFTGGWLVDTQSPTAEVSARITNFIRSTSKFTITPTAAAGQFATGDSYYALLSRLTPRIVDGEVRQSFIEAWRWLSVPQKKEFQFSGAQFTVPVYPEIAQYGAYRVELQPWIAYADMPWPSIDAWEPSPDGSLVKFPPYLVWQRGGRSVRIWGVPPLPTLDSGAIFTYVEDGDDEIIVEHIAGSLLMLLGARSYTPQAAGTTAMDSPMRAGGAMLQQALKDMQAKNRHLRAGSAQGAWVNRAGASIAY